MKKTYANLSEFKKDNKELFLQPIVQKFFKDAPENVVLLEKSVVHGIPEAIEQLDKKFSEYFFLYRLVKYISVLSSHFSIDYDKQYRKQRERYLLLVDKPQVAYENNTNTMIDTLTSKDSIENTLSIGESTSMSELLEDEILHNIILKLTKNEQEVLKLIYIDQLKQVEVAKKLNKSPQNIAKIKKKALEKIKNEYIRRKENL